MFSFIKNVVELGTGLGIAFALILFSLGVLTSLFGFSGHEYLISGSVVCAAIGVFFSGIYLLIN